MLPVEKKLCVVAKDLQKTDDKFQSRDSEVWFESSFEIRLFLKYSDVYVDVIEMAFWDLHNPPGPQLFF
jgi:hypothetical protein